MTTYFADSVPILICLVELSAVRRSPSIVPNLDVAFHKDSVQLPFCSQILWSRR